MLCGWLAKRALLSEPMKSKTGINCHLLPNLFFCTLHQKHAFVSNTTDWLIDEQHFLFLLEQIMASTYLLGACLCLCVCGGGGGGRLEDSKMLTANTHFSKDSASCPAYGFSEHICSTHNKPTCNNLYY